MSINDARSFIKQLKDMGGDQREEYYMFIEIMKDFKAQTYINVPIIIIIIFSLVNVIDGLFVYIFIGSFQDRHKRCLCESKGIIQRA